MGSQHSNFSNPFQELDLFRQSADVEQHLIAISQTALENVKSHYKDVKQLARSIEDRGTAVYVLPGTFWVNVMLSCLGHEPGFIAPPETPSEVRRFETLKKILAMFEKKTVACSDAHGIFVVPHKLFTVGFMAHQLHHWLAHQAGLPGYNKTARTHYRAFCNRNGELTQDHLRNMSVEEVTELRHAVQRDLQALQFIRRVTDEIFIPAQQAKHLKQGFTHG